MIIVKPNGGLGNRMRVINSAICLSGKNNNAPVKVLWKKDAGMNAGFTDIFESVNKNKIEVVENKLLMAYYFYSRKQLPLNYKYYDDQSILDKRFNENYWSNGHRNTIINTCYDFYYPEIPNNFFGMFRPVKKIQGKIDSVTQCFSKEWVGVHIRRTDHQIAREKSGTADFIYRMDDILEKSSNIKFYLSTDDLATELQLRKRYGSRIVALEGKSINRNSLAGIEDAVTDMFCLSKTKLILGSYSSSFSEVASAIGKVPLETISKSDLIIS